MSRADPPMQSGQVVGLSLVGTNIWLFLRVAVCMYVWSHSKNMDQPGKVANHARGQLNRENEYFSVGVRA